jgi:hypothetical protein
MHVAILIPHKSMAETSDNATPACQYLLYVKIVFQTAGASTLTCKMIGIPRFTLRVNFRHDITRLPLRWRVSGNHVSG